MSNTNNNMQTQTSSVLHNAVMEVSGKDCPLMLSPDANATPVTPGNKGTSQQQPRGRTDNDIYSTVDACPNAIEMWKAIKRLKQGESINIQDLETNLYWAFGKFASHKGKAIANSTLPIYDPKPKVVADDDASSKEKEIDKLMDLILTGTWYDRQTRQYDNQGAVNVAVARGNVGTQELKAHYMYMAKIQEVTLDVAANSRPIFDAEPLQKQSQKRIKNDKVLKKKSSSFRELDDKFFEIQDFKTQLQDKNIAISELKKLIDKLKRKYVENKFEKPSVIRQPNAFKCKKQSILGVIPTTSVSRPHLKSTRLEDRVLHNNSQGKKFLNAKTSNVNFICVNCGKCTMRFGNDQFAPILKYGDLVQGNVTIKRVYYVEGLNHNLFSIGRFCDVDLEVVFWKSTCYVHDLKGNDLLTGSRGIEHQTSVARTPEQNGIVKRRNRTLVEAARTMLSATKVPLFFWAEAIATTCFTQNHGENLDKMKEKGDACIFVGYSTMSRDHVSSNSASQYPITALEHESLSPDPQSQVNVPLADETVTTSINELDMLFSLMFDEYFNGASLVVSKSSAVSNADAFDKHQQQNITLSTLTTDATYMSPLII
nr:putative ribonuclease H-like domain-containing protein [Tanacetum cinerariifolium]